jgi:hypothetical protein
VCVCVCVCVCCVCVCVCIYIYIYIYICVYTYIYTYIYICIHNSSSNTCLFCCASLSNFHDQLCLSLYTAFLGYSSFTGHRFWFLINYSPFLENSLHAAVRYSASKDSHSVSLIILIHCVQLFQKQTR